MSETYLPRLVDHLLAELLDEFSALLVVGPRAIGKTTTAARHAKTVLRLDRPTDAAPVRADPDAALRGLEEPILLDEWQAVPEVLGAVKRAVDTDPRPGRFILTGSVRADLQADGWPGTGRLVRVGMTGLTVRELRQADLSEPPFLTRVLDGGVDALRVPSERLDLRDYLELATTSGFPEPALRLSESGRQRWLDSYLQQLLTRDVAQLSDVRAPERLGRYFQSYVLNTAGVVANKTLYEAAGINSRTADAYEQLLRDLLVVDVVPAWSSNLLKRLMKTPKRYVVDPGLVAGSLRTTANGLLRSGDLFGRVLDTFVAAQLRAELPLSPFPPKLFHLRDEGGAHEIDLLIELDLGRMIGIEVKASAAPGRDAARHLRWLRDQLGDRFAAGIVFHTGGRVVALDDRIIAAPISSLWS